MGKPIPSHGTAVESRDGETLTVFPLRLPQPRGKGLVFLSEEEKCPLLRIPCNGGEQHFTTLLSDLARTDITSVYRLGEFPLFLCAQPHGSPWRAMPGSV